MSPEFPLPKISIFTEMGSFVCAEAFRASAQNRAGINNFSIVQFYALNVLQRTGLSNTGIEVKSYAFASIIICQLKYYYSKVQFCAEFLTLHVFHERLP